MQQSKTKTGVTLTEIKSNLTKLQNLSINEQKSVKGGCSSCTADLRRSGV
jgi:hypothetical protein